MAYQSRTRLFGLPLIDVAIGGASRVPGRSVARGWIAVGDIAFGVVFAVGGVAIGGISIGGLGIGALAVAGVALGFAPVGGLAVGMFAFGGAAFGGVAAMGGLAVAREIAVGGSAVAAHANDAVARQYVQTSLFFQAADIFMSSQWILAVLIAPVLVVARAIARSRRR